MNNSDFIALVLEALSIDVSAPSDGNNHPALEDIWLHALEAEPTEAQKTSALESHIQECEACRALLEGAIDELRSVRGLTPVEPAERRELLTQTRERLRQWIREKGTSEKPRRPGENDAGNKAKPTVHG